MTRKEIQDHQSEITELVKEFGVTGHEKSLGLSLYKMRKSYQDAVPVELDMLKTLKYFQGLRLAKQAEIEKAKAELVNTVKA